MRYVGIILLFWLTGCMSLFGQTITVMIDPGHGGSDPGHEAINSGQMDEKDLNLLIAKKFGNYLSTRLSHVKVIYTRTDDSFVSLDDRVEMANSKDVDYFISVHCNGSDNVNIHGTESHVHNHGASKSVKLAKIFEKEFSTRAGRKSRGVKTTEDREHSLQVLKFTEMTSVLVECGFVTNSTEAAYLNTDSGQDVLASALFRGLRTYLQEQHPAIAFTETTGATGTNATAENTESSGSTGYTVQIMSSKEPIDTGSESFKKLEKPVVREKIAETGYKYRYITGTFTSKEAANTYRDEVRKQGFPDAIVVTKKKT